MKNSEVGMIPNHWRVDEIGHVGKVVGGGTPRKSIDEYWNGNVPWITPKDLSNYRERLIYEGSRSISQEGLENSSAKILPPGTVLLSSRAPIGYLAIAGTNVCTNQGFKSIICDKRKVDNLFLYYLLMEKKEALISIAGGSTFKEVSGKLVKQFKIPIPPLDEQKYISRILSKLDDKIEINNRINHHLEAMAQAIFKHWFVDFEFPNENGEPYKSSGGEMTESELGLIPKGWRVRNLGEIIEVLDSKRIPLSKKERSKRKNCYPYFGATGLMDYVDDYLFGGTYVLLGEDGTVIDEHGFPVLQYVWGKFWVNNHAHVLKGKSNISEEFILMLLKNTSVSSIVTGAVQPKINQRNLRSLSVVLPVNETLIKQYSKDVAQCFLLIKGNIEQTKRLSALRDTLLPKLMSGEIRVPVEES
ncbi:MAG: restriction endonuclease subunit S [Sporolactobacillus sp.]|jgi:type I restriction enzyme S subunit|nr:restriction endonuclease subunit S [Sporolactobacillus sp.]